MTLAEDTNTSLLCCPVITCGSYDSSFGSHPLLLQHFYAQATGHQQKVTYRLNTGRRTITTVFYRQPQDFCFCCPCDHYKERYATEEALKAHLLSVEKSGEAGRHSTLAYTKPSVPSSMTARALRGYEESGVLGG
jgi:hypothetical protein